MRSRHTGHVGSSISAGVGGALGLVLRAVESIDGVCVAVSVFVDISTLATEGVKGSLVMSGKEACWPTASDVRNSMDLTKTTWQFSGCDKHNP